MFDGSTTQTMLRSARLAALLLAMTAAGCATTTSPTRNPEIASDLRNRQGSTDDDALSREARAQQIFLRAMTQARLGDHESALDLYAQALDLAPRTAAILAAMAESQELMGDESDALQSMRRARSLEPENAYYALQLAELYLSTGDGERAARVYREVLEHAPDNVDALYELARVYTVNGDLNRAVATYEQVLDEIGADRDVQNQILRLYARQDDVQGMERTLRGMLEESPHDAQLHRALAEVYGKQERYLDAVDALREALEIDRGDVETMLDLAEMYRVLGRAAEADSLLGRASSFQSADPTQLLAQAASLYARAEDDEDARTTAKRILERVLKLDPGRHEALVMLGNLRLDAGAYQEAGDLFYRALDVNPRDSQLWMQAASAFLQAGHFDRAVEVADEGLMLFPGSLALLRIAGYALMDSYQNGEAARRFEMAVRIIQEDESEDATGLADLYSALGLLYARMNEVDRSDQSYEKAIGIDPENAPALNNYAFNLAQRNEELDRALSMAKRAVEIDPGVPSYIDTLGWVFFRMGEHEQALRHIRRAADHPDASAAVFEHLGDVYDALGQTVPAADAWHRALELNPQRSELRDKLSRE